MVVRLKGFEPLTPALEGRCSILLSYKRIFARIFPLLRAFVGAGDGNRTHAASLEGWNSTIELHPHAIYTTPKNNSTIEEKSQRFLRYIATIFVRSFPDSTKAQQYAR